MIDIQAQDRAHRIGQTKPVVVYRFIVRNTIDERVYKRACSKQIMEKLIVHDGSFYIFRFFFLNKKMSFFFQNLNKVLMHMIQ
jgi:SNF2 family DNA or RNA helicase